MHSIVRMTPLLSIGYLACAGGHRDPIRSDPEKIDRAHPPEIEGIEIPSPAGGMLGTYLTANGAGPHPTLLLLHGFPGNETNFDIAHAARRAGWNVLVFHYRGSWGSPGTFSFAGAVEDAATALAYLRRPGVSHELRVDVDRIAVAGHSMGGFIALWTAAHDPNIIGAASLAGFDFGAAAANTSSEADRAGWVEAFQEALPPLNAESAVRLVDEFLARGEQWSLSGLASRFGQRPLLLAAASEDIVAPPDVHHTPLVRSYRSAGVRLSEVVLAGDHGFSARRVALTRALLAWCYQIERAG